MTRARTLQQPEGYHITMTLALQSSSILWLIFVLYRFFRRMAVAISSCDAKMQGERFQGDDQGWQTVGSRAAA